MENLVERFSGGVPRVHVGSDGSHGSQCLPPSDFWLWHLSYLTFGVDPSFFCTSSQDIYDESCTFTDEIDTYQKDKFIKGTKALFVASESQVELLGDVDVLENGKKLQFRFQETLAFEAQLVGGVGWSSCRGYFGCGSPSQKPRFNFPVVHPKAGVDKSYWAGDNSTEMVALRWLCQEPAHLHVVMMVWLLGAPGILKIWNLKDCGYDFFKNPFPCGCILKAETCCSSNLS